MKVGNPQFDCCLACCAGVRVDFHAYCLPILQLSQIQRKLSPRHLVPCAQHLVPWGWSITSHRCDDHIDPSRVHQLPALTDQNEEILCLLDASSLSWKRLSYRIIGYRVVRKKILIMLQKMESNGETSNAQSSSKPRIIKAPQGHCVGQVS